MIGLAAVSYYNEFYLARTVGQIYLIDVNKTVARARDYSDCHRSESSRSRRKHSPEPLPEYRAHLYHIGNVTGTFGKDNYRLNNGETSLLLLLIKQD